MFEQGKNICSNGASRSAVLRCQTERMWLLAPFVDDSGPNLLVRGAGTFLLALVALLLVAYFLRRRRP